MSSTSHSDTTLSNRMPGLDFLRAFAALWVFAFHFMELVPAPLKPAIASFYINIGWNGVDLFFVLSGFLIGSILNRENENVKSFMIRRFFRIYPAYFVVLALCVFINKPYFIDNHELIVSHVFLYNNLIPGYGGAINGVLWTLGAEFQFYILAALILLIPKWRGFWFFLIGAMFLCSCLYKSFVFGAMDDFGQRFFYSTQLPGMLSLFAMGFLAVQLRKYFGRFISRHFLLFFMLSMISLSFYFSWLRPHLVDYWDSKNPMVYGRFFSGMAFSVLVLVFSCAPDWLGAIFKKSGFVFFGEISYGIYLTHLFWFDFMAPYNAFFTDFGWVVYASLLVGLTFASSCLIYFLIERPFIRFGARLASKSRAGKDGNRAPAFPR